MASDGEEKATGDPASEASWCGELSSLVQVTVVPAFTVSVDGLKAKFLIAMVFPPEAGVCVAAAEGAGPVEEEQPADRQARISSIAHADQNRVREWVDILPQ